MISVCYVNLDFLQQKTAKSDYLRRGHMRVTYNHGIGRKPLKPRQLQEFSVMSKVGRAPAKPGRSRTERPTE